MAPAAAAAPTGRRGRRRPRRHPGQFLSAERSTRDRVRDPILASWWRSRRVPACPPTGSPCPTSTPSDLRHAADPQRRARCCAGSASSSTASRSASSSPTRPASCCPSTPATPTCTGTSSASSSCPGSATASSSSAPTASAPRWRTAADARVRPRALRGEPGEPRVRGRADPAPDLGQDDRRDRPDLLAQGRGPAAHRAGPDRPPSRSGRRCSTHSDVRETGALPGLPAACRRTMGIVMAFNDDVVMMNDRARQLLDPADQSVLLGHASPGAGRGRPATATVTLPTGGQGRGCSAGRVAGRPGHDVDRRGAHRSSLSSPSRTITELGGPVLPMFLPGAVGSAPLWLRCCHEVDAGYGRGEWLVLAGEAGVGKYTPRPGRAPAPQPVGPDARRWTRRPPAGPAA